MNKENNEIKEEFLQFINATTDYSKDTIRHKNEVLTSYIDLLKNKHLKDVKEQDVIKYLSRFGEQTYNPRLSILNQFYRWYLKLEEKQKPEFTKRLKYKSLKKIRNRNKMKYREKIVTEEEYQTMIDHCTKYQHKAIIQTLWCFGIRNSELRSMKIKGVEYNKDGNTKIIVYHSKSMPREVVYDGRAEYLLTWIENYHPNRNNKESYVFTSNGNRTYTKTGIDEVLKRTCKRANLRKILPHDFRHTSITNARKNGIPDTHIENNHGLVQGSKMMSVYDHNEIRDYEDYLKQRKQIIKPKYEELEKQKKTLEEKHEKEIKQLREEFKEMKKWWDMMGLRVKDENELEVDLASETGDPKIPRGKHYVSKIRITERDGKKTGKKI